jgi:translocation and assembly module TamA
MRWVKPRQFFTALLLGLCGFIAAWGPNANAETLSDWAENSAAKPLAFSWVVTSENAEIRDFLLKHMALSRFQALSDLDDTELTRLLDNADEQARELLATQGFFNPQLSWQQDKTKGPHPLGQVTLTVKTGPPARISQVQWQWLGELTQATTGPQQQAHIQNQWGLPPGAPFTQAAWSQAKNNALRQLVSEHYPWGRLATSEARVDAENNQVLLSVTVDSGPAVRLGALNITGATKYGALQVERLARLSPDQPYRQSDLLEAQQRLVLSGFYDSVFVSLEPQGNLARAPVNIELKESLRQRWLLGVGMRSDSGPRLTAEHTHHSIPGLNWRAVSRLAIDKDLQTMGLDLLAPPDSTLWRWNTSAQINRQVRDNDVISSQRWRAGRIQIGPRIDRSYYAQYDVASQQSNVLGHLESVSGNFAWTWRDFDSLPFPSRGLGLGLELGTGVSLGATHQPYVRWLAKGLSLWPLGQNSGRLAVRASMGSVVSQDTRNLPTTQLFLTGGDNSVRGYALNSIGVDLGNGQVGAGRYLSTGSVEWQRPLRWKGQLTEWETAVFADAGAVANELHLLHTQWSYGVGARWRSPIGPVRMDLAHAQALQKWRLHLSVGFTF